MDWNEDNIEEFILANKHKFDSHVPKNMHERSFLVKLRARFMVTISIVPYLIRVAVCTVLVFAASVWAWNSYIRKDRHEITLKQKIENVTIIVKHWIK